MGPVVFKSAEICLQKWGELSSKGGASCLLRWGELSSKSEASCLGASFMWGELSWGELSLGRVVLIPLGRKAPQVQRVTGRFHLMSFRVQGYVHTPQQCQHLRCSPILITADTSVNVVVVVVARNLDAPRTYPYALPYVNNMADWE